MNAKMTVKTLLMRKDMRGKIHLWGIIDHYNDVWNYAETSVFWGASSSRIYLNRTTPFSAILKSRAMRKLSEGYKALDAASLAKSYPDAFNDINMQLMIKKLKNE